MRASPHGKALHKQSKRLLASVEAVDDTLSAYIVTQSWESYSKAAATTGPKQKDQEKSLGKRLVRRDVKISIVFDWNAQEAEICRCEAL